MFNKWTCAGICFLATLFGMVLIDKKITESSSYHPSPIATKPLPPSIPPPDGFNPPVPPFPNTELHVDVPMEMRIFNKSGSQCVWATIEMLGKLHKVKGVQGLTNELKHATGPGEVNRVLTRKNVKFRQVTGKDLDFLEEWVTKKRMGCGIGVNGNHVILVCHFERGKSVKVIDNSDPTLQVQTWDWNKFQSKFSGWVFVILPDDSTGLAGHNNNVDDGRLYR